MTDPFKLTRREDREIALALLYEADMTGDDMATVLARQLEEDGYGLDVATGVAANLADLDSMIDATSGDWPVSRMAGIDRTILRMGVFELAHRHEVPTSAVVSEAVALANQYSTEKSAPFINGILAALTKSLRPDA